MTRFEGIYPLDFIFIKFKDKKAINSLPLCEVFEGAIVKEKTNDETVVLLVHTAQNKDGKTVEPISEELSFSKIQIKKLLTKNLGMMVQDFEVQPEGEMLLSSVQAFIEKYTS
jgi:hypothetical protein